MESFDFEVYGREDRYISADLTRDGIWEPFETEVFRRLCRCGDFVLDIGANIGWYSVVASRLVGAAGAVYAFEPGQSNLALLRRNLERSSGPAQVKILRLALGESISQSKLFLSANNFGDHQLFDDGTQRKSEAVEVQSLDSLFEGQSRLPTLVKSDTQGSEGRILTGANRLLAYGWRPIWLLEFWPYGMEKACSDPLSIWRRIAALGYASFEINETKGRLVRLTESVVKARLRGDISPESMGFLNILALPEPAGRWESVADLLTNDREGLP